MVIILIPFRATVTVPVCPVHARRRRRRSVAVPQGKRQPVYQTAVAAEDVAETLAEYFRERELTAQVFDAAGNRVVMQARKESLIGEHPRRRALCTRGDHRAVPVVTFFIHGGVRQLTYQLWK
jgi:hypothetical protein